MNELKDRLRQALKVSGMSQAEFARSSGVSKTNIVYILNGRNASTSTDNLAAMARALGVSISYLMGESDDMGRSLSPNYVELHYIDKHKKELDETRVFERTHFDSLECVPERCVLFKCISDSMAPLINPGDSVLINRSDTAPTASPHVYALFINGEVQLARLQLEFGQITVSRVNAAFQPRNVDYDDFTKDVEIIGRVVDRFGSGGL